MGNSLSCFEKGDWDSHQDVKGDYPAQAAVYQDMKQPLTHYFISAGHNSYLTGNQLTSASGTSTITACLLANCRVVELDVYNGPVCKHGGTLTSPVPFKDCVEAVRDNAFKNSRYPVIITIENHADSENQIKMAAILKDVLGELLYVPDAADPRTVYKSPEELANKVVCRTTLKAKTPIEFASLIYICNSKFTSYAEMLKREKIVSSSFEEGVLPEVEDLGKDVEDEAAETARQHAKLAKQQAARQQRQQRRQQKKQQKQQQQEQQQQLASQASKGAGGGGGAAGDGGVGEGDADEDDGADVEGDGLATGLLYELYGYTAKHLMRVYPAGWRVTSGNFNPMLAWVRGASLAALNWQVWDRSLRINHGKFLDNGSCGYVLKPRWMLRPGSDLPGRPGRALKVTVHSAHLYQDRNCCVFKDDLFVKLDVYGMPVDRETYFTATAANSGRLVVDKVFDFVVRFPEMGVLLVQLMDEDTGAAANHVMADVLGYFALPLATLCEGDFKLALLDPDSGRPLPGHRRAWIKVRLEWGADKNAAAEAAAALDPMREEAGAGTLALKV